MLATSLADELSQQTCVATRAIVETLEATFELDVDNVVQL